MAEDGASVLTFEIEISGSLTRSNFYLLFEEPQCRCGSMHLCALKCNVSDHRDPYPDKCQVLHKSGSEEF